MTILSALVGLSVTAGEATARCNSGQGWNQVTALRATLTNNGASLGMTACSNVGDGFQEEHHDNGELWDYKLGNTGPGTVDPRRRLGSWTVANDNSNQATVSYLYDAFGSNTTTGPFSVFVNGNDYDFCNGNTSVGIFRLIPTTGTSRVCP